MLCNICPHKYTVAENVNTEVKYKYLKTVHRHSTNCIMWLCSSYGYEVKALIKRWIVWSKCDVSIIFRRECSCCSAFTRQVSHAWEEVCLRVCALWSILRLRWAAAVLCETSTSANLCDGVRHTGDDANARVCLCVWKDVGDARFKSSAILAASLCSTNTLCVWVCNAEIWMFYWHF